VAIEAAVFSDKPAAKKGKEAPAHQPFNVGKWSSVVKVKPDALALSSGDESETSIAKAPAKGKGKARAKPAPKKAVKSVGKGKRKAASSSDESASASDFQLDSDDDRAVGDDYAGDSEEEEAQLAKALKASKKGGRAPVGKKPRISGKAAGQTAGGKGKGRADAIRSAAAEAAESEFRDPAGKTVC
jgi:hypothetical protein